MTGVTVPASISPLRTSRSSLLRWARNRSSGRSFTNREMIAAATGWISGPIQRPSAYPTAAPTMTSFPFGVRERSPENEGAFAFGLDLILDGLERILEGDDRAGNQSGDRAE
jgi:hypothetical protein